MSRWWFRRGPGRLFLIGLVGSMEWWSSYLLEKGTPAFAAGRHGDGSPPRSLSEEQKSQAML